MFKTLTKHSRKVFGNFFIKLEFFPEWKKTFATSEAIQE